MRGVLSGIIPAIILLLRVDLEFDLPKRNQRQGIDVEKTEKWIYKEIYICIPIKDLINNNDLASRLYLPSC
jgi:hypothetical protein